MHNETGYCAVLLLFGYLSVQDIKSCRISARPIGWFGGAALVYLYFQHLAAEEWILRIAPGMFLVLLAWATRESIGYGDGAAVMVLGLWCGALFSILTLCMAFFLAGICALVRLVKGNRQPLPFLPFLLIAMEVVWFYE